MMKHYSSSVRKRGKRFQSPLPSERVKTWKRSDTISILSVIISILSVVFAAKSADVATQAETRVRKTESREVEAVAIAVGSKVRSITNGAEFSAQFMQGYMDHKASNPKDLDQIDAYIIELAGSPEFPELTLLPEQIAAMARVDSNAAGMLAACSDRRADIQIDSKKFAEAKPGRLTHIQMSIAQVMPYRLRELREACNASLNALIALVPQLPKIMGPIRGTLGELMEAESSSRKERERGTSVELHIGKNKHKGKQAISNVELAK